MKRSHVLSVVLVLLGVGVSALATAIPAWLPEDTFWTEEQAREQSQAAARLHQMTHESAHSSISERATDDDRVQAQVELEAAQARFDQSKAALDQAQFYRKTLPSYLRWIGGAMAVAGVILYYVGREHH